MIYCLLSAEKTGAGQVGILYDYFRAGGDEAASAVIDAAGGGSLVVDGETPSADVADLKGIGLEVT